MKHQYLLLLLEGENIKPYLHLTEKKLEQTELKTIQKYMSIAEFFFELPSNELKSLAFTEDLEKFWVGARRTNADIGRLFIGNQLNAVEEFIDIDGLNASGQVYFDLIDSISKRYIRLHKLIRHSFKKIKKNLSNKYATPEDLFFALAKNERELPFVNLIQQDYVEYIPRKIEIFARKISVYSATGHNYTQEKTPLGVIPASITDEVFQLIEKTLKRDRRARSLARDYNSARESYWDCLADFMSYRDKDGRLVRDLTYKDGQICFHSYGRN